MTHRGANKPRDKRCTCRLCGSEFLAADPKAATCQRCRDPRACLCGCGIMVKTPGHSYAPGHNPGTHAASVHARQAAAITGDGNPAKRASVRMAISIAVAQNHPSKTHVDLWRRLARQNRPLKHSGLETIIAKMWPGAMRRVRVAGYEFDFGRDKLLLEVQGCWYHCCQFCFPGSPSFETQRNTVSNDAKKQAAAEALGYRIVYVWEHAIREDRFVALYRALGVPDEFLSHEEVPVRGQSPTPSA